MTTTLLIILIASSPLLLLVLFFLFPIFRPIKTESDLSTPGFPWWKLYYIKKYFRPVRRSAGGKADEIEFREMPFEFDKKPLADTRHAVIHAVGDLMCRPDLYGAHEPLWQDIGKDLFSADLCIGNLEFAVNPNWLIHRLYRYSVMPEKAEPFLGDPRFGHFHVLTLGNNHINDSLSQGIIATCDYLDTKAVLHVGAGRTIQEQDEFPIVEVGGIKVAVLSYTFSTNGIPREKTFLHGVNLVRFNALDDEDYYPALIHRHIGLAKQRRAEYIVACLHWGVEFEQYPPLRIRERGRALLDAGIDCIIGHHPHILNPVEHYKTRDGRDGLIFYSLGNVTTYALIGYTKKIGEIAGITLESGADASGRRVVRPSKVSLLPFVYFRDAVRGRGVEHRLLPLFAGAQAVRDRTAAEQYPRRARGLLKRSEKHYRRYWRQRGIEYR